MTVQSAIRQPGSVVHVLLSEGMEIALDGRTGTVTEVRPTEYLVLWHELVNNEDGVVSDPFVSPLTHVEVQLADRQGRLTILNHQHEPAKGTKKWWDSPSAEEEKRMRHRWAYVRAAEELLSAGEMKLRRADFEANLQAITDRGLQIFFRWLRDQTGQKARKCGAAAGLTYREPPKSGASVYRWYRDYLEKGEKGLFDDLSKSGNRKDRYTEKEQAIMAEVIHKSIDKERASIASITESVRVHIRTYRRKAGGGGNNLVERKGPSREVVRRLIDQIAPFEHKIRQRGLKVAYMDMHGLGVGIETRRALERVEIDEYPVDLMVLMKRTGILEILPEAVLEKLDLDGAAERVTISAAIDVHTRCLLAMKIGKEPSARLAVETVEMMLMDKSSISDGIAMMDWPMSGRPEELVLDRGPSYKSDDAYNVVAALGITYLGAPAKKPWLRPFIESLFRTIHAKLLQRFPGRTFSNVVERGENDPAARAGLTLDELLEWLVRWIVDIYHLKPHRGLNGQTPYAAWQNAVENVSPNGVSHTEMRMVFGIKDVRKFTRQGIRVHGLCYFVDELAQEFRYGDEVEIAWWPGDIGAIGVKKRDGRWINVLCVEERWLGKPIWSTGRFCRKTSCSTGSIRKSTITPSQRWMNSPGVARGSWVCCPPAGPLRS